MSGLLRRIKRSRPADAGEPLPEGQAAAPEGAAPATEPATAVTEPVSPEPEPQPQPEPKTETPVLLADPNTPAGVDPAAAPMRPPAGRRGRLRRRLRYLRRARELMLRDLGGLLYEIHRTGGGNVEAHGNIVRAKVQRIAGLDAEAHALETALATSRPEAVVFQPGVGGACPACGEYYGSAARFCSNCGAPITAVAVPAPMPGPAADATPVPATRESVFGRPAPPTQGLSSGDPLRASTDQPTAALGAAAGGAAAAAQAPAAEERQTADETAVLAPAEERSSGEEIPPAGAAEKPGARDAAAGVESGPSHEAGALDPAASDEPTDLGAPATDEPAAVDPAAGDDRGARDEAAQRFATSGPGAGDEVAAGGQPAVGDDVGTSAEPAARDEVGASADPAALDPAAGGDVGASAGPDPSDDRGAIAEPAAGDDIGPSAEPAAGDDAGASEKPIPSDEPGASDPQDDAGRNPFAGLRNGRTEEDHTPPELSSGDPLATRDTRS